MPRYIVRRTFPEACTFRSMGAGLTCALASVIERNAEEGVTWISSFVSEGKTLYRFKTVAMCRTWAS
jgi:hypothetical protein